AFLECERQESDSEEGQSMKKIWLSALAVVSLVMVSAPLSVRAQSADSIRDFVHVAGSYQLTPNLTYRTASNWDAKLDVYQPRGLKPPSTTMLFFHGGGWTNGTKEASTLSLLPYLQTGWTVVHVAYRMTNVGLAPAAVEDAPCARRR